VVKNPNQAALLQGTSSVAARQGEDMFFESAAPWNRMSSDQKGRLGEGIGCHTVLLFLLQCCPVCVAACSTGALADAGSGVCTAGLFWTELLLLLFLQARCGCVRR
jgi:hypothetical protein